MIVRPDGPPNAKVMIVGEAPGEHEENQGIPFVGPSGYELNRMLSEVGISRSECFVSNVMRTRPPNNDIERFVQAKPTKAVPGGKKALLAEPIRVGDRWATAPIRDGIIQLQKEIQLVKPKLIIAVGNTSMWALTGRWGIKKWRGSMLYSDPIGGQQYKVIPTYHPAAVLREWYLRAITVNDLRRAKRFINDLPFLKPKWNFTTRPSYAEVICTLDQLLSRLDNNQPLRISFDLETSLSHIACAGLAWSQRDAICIPFMAVGKAEGYWTADQEAEIVWRLRQILTHEKVEVIGQNLLYDAQYTWRYWFFVPRVTQDTMISQHSCFSDLPKALGFLASMYCDYYVYWKDEGKGLSTAGGEDQGWYYNCEDCVYTYEVAEALQATVSKLGLQAVHNSQQAMFWPVLKAMQRGVRIDKARRDEMTLEVQEAIAEREQLLIDILGHSLNPDSPKQMHTLFYTDLKMPIQFKRAKKGVPGNATLDDDALQKLVRIEPLLRPIINSISDIRTLGKFLSNFLCRSLDADGRMRCAYNIGGSESGKSAPKTFRLSSSENAFGSGTNLQNIPSEKSKSLGKAKARGGLGSLGNPYTFPNIREIFIPDQGNTWFDLDLERADLFVVAWEAADEQLKAAMRLGVDIHLLNAYILQGKEPPPMEELVESHPKYADHRGAQKYVREFAKVFCHGTNYGGKARTMAAHTGRTISEIERAQRIWFSAHPGIERWHNRVRDEMAKKRYVENRFGYRWYVFDRLENVLPEAIAWIPQSTVSIVINRIWQRIDAELPEVEVLMQVHDSLPGQMPTHRVAELLPKIREFSKIVVPYPDPLVIPVSIKTSDKSWGHC